MHPLKRTWLETIMVQCSYVCLSYTSLSYTLASLHCCQIITMSMPLIHILHSLVGVLCSLMWLQYGILWSGYCCWYSTIVSLHYHWRNHIQMDVGISSCWNMLHMLVRNYHYSLQNNSEERSSHLLHGRSLISHMLHVIHSLSCNQHSH